MTEEQEKQFILYGCGSRCLIAIANDLGIPITREEFIDRFSPDYPSWSSRCGITTTSMLIDLASKIGISHSADTTADFDLVSQHHNEGRLKGTILMTARQPTDNGMAVVHHARWITGRNDSNLLVWHPDGEGEDLHNQPVPLQELVCLKSHFLMFLA